MKRSEMLKIIQNHLYESFYLSTPSPLLYEAFESHAEQTLTLLEESGMQPPYVSELSFKIADENGEMTGAVYMWEPEDD